MQASNARFLNIAFYRFVSLATDSAGLIGLRDELRLFCRGLPELRGTLLISEEGINGMLCGPSDSISTIRKFFEGREAFAGMEYKESVSGEQAFPRMLVKIKKEIIPLGRPDVRPALETGARLSPLELKTWLDEGRELILLDTRNEYEIEAGTFEGAQSLGLERFRQFPEKLEKLGETGGRPVVMFCTGGIRCEKATALAQKMGIPNVYQLDGGILRYFKECGDAHYRGNCFVFDHRDALDSGLSGKASRRPFEE